MPNLIDSNGIQIETYSQIVNDILNGTSLAPGLYTIYGSNINVAQNSPDGQFVNIFALSKQDMLNLCVSIYNSFNPDFAVGTSLDAIAQISGLTRSKGTYTQVAVTLVTSQNLNLSGLDTSTPYTISDSNGNLAFLITSTSLTASSFSLNFQAANIGAVTFAQNTLTVPVTIIPGVVSVNNPSLPFQNGVNQETDSNFRLRRQASTAFPAQGPLQALFAGLNATSGVNQAVVYENTSSITDLNGIPGHGIWVITDGGLSTLIGNTIYIYRSLGVPMLGSITVMVPQIDGSNFAVSYDSAVNQNLWVKATLSSLNGTAIDRTAIAAQLVQNYLFKIYQVADISTLDQQIRNINPNVVCSNLGVSAEGTNYFALLYPTLKKNKWFLTTGNITLL